jgi:Uncharacterized conserved protein
MISSARQGDMHVCPLPGHGTTPIASSSTDVSINGMGSARVGDKWEKNPGPHRSEDIPGLRAWDDIPDRRAITIGINLYRRLPTGEITAPIIMGEVLAIGSKWGKGIREHLCK